MLQFCTTTLESSTTNTADVGETHRGADSMFGCNSTTVLVAVTVVVGIVRLQPIAGRQTQKAVSRRATMIPRGFSEMNDLGLT